MLGHTIDSLTDKSSNALAPVLLLVVADYGICRPYNCNCKHVLQLMLKHCKTWAHAHRWEANAMCSILAYTL